MTVHKRLTVTLTLPIDPPHPFIAHNVGNPEVLANRVQWERAFTEDGDLGDRAIVLAEHGLNRSYWPDDEPIPDWIPRPAVAWQAIVSELAAEVLA